MPIRPPVYRPAGFRSAAQRRTDYDAARQRAHSTIYGRRWQKLRALYLDAHPICECGCGYAATVVDHKTPHNGNVELGYAWDNLQAMTKQCHDRKTAARDGGFGNPVSRQPQIRSA